MPPRTVPARDPRKSLTTLNTPVAIHASQFTALSAVPALATSHTAPKQMRSLRNTASATNPPNQYSIVSTSSASSPIRPGIDAATFENFHGTTTSAASEKSVHTGEKIMKFTSTGDIMRQWDQRTVGHETEDDDREQGLYASRREDNRI
ncbi:hypothetical protein N0V90_012351 [Kalmusia sp. IMI 367209]|nr:hypothetical protein N0V90_012351 [Kalmusia sp. IMI 367209]